MGRRELRLADDVSSSLSDLRTAARQGEASFERLSTLRGAAAERQALRSATGRTTHSELLDELGVRDEQLAAAIAELRHQIDALERASSLLERERAKYLDLFMHAPEAYVVTDLDGITHDANVAAGSLFCAEARFLIGRPLISFVARADTRAFRLLLQELSAHERDARSFTLRMRPRGQPVFVACGRASVFRSDADRGIGVRWSLRSLDAEQAESGKRLADAELAQALAADLRGPLSTVSSWSRMLIEGRVGDGDEREQAIRWIHTGAVAQEQVLEELGELCAICERQELRVPELFDLGAVVREVVAGGAAGGAPPERKGRCSVQGDGPTEAAWVRAERKDIARAVALLVGHALAGTAQNGPPLVLRTWVGGGQAVLDLTAPEGARTPDGWGVRMAIASRLVERHGGRLVSNEHSPSCRVRLPHASP